MLRHTLLSASALALFSTAACAQEETMSTQSPDASAAAMVDSEVKILDAAQVDTKDEAKLFAESEFKQADINQDGEIDKNEFLAYAVIRAPIEDPSVEGLDEPDITDEESVAATEEPANAEEQFAEISNGDEKISQTEMVESRVAQFEEADVNGDEALDEDERKAFIKLSQLKPSASTSL